MIFFSADLHLGETRLEIMQREQFGDSYVHDESILCPLLELEDDDELIINGDVVSKSSKNPEESLEHLKKIKAKLILIRGNHDEQFTDEQLYPYFDEIIDHGDGIEMEYEGIPLYVTHYPTLAVKDRFNLTGHIHAGWKFQLNSLNVGVDVHNFQPVPIKKVPFFYKAINEFYDDDMWAAYVEANQSFKGKRGKSGSYYPPKSD